MICWGVLILSTTSILLALCIILFYCAHKITKCSSWVILLKLELALRVRRSTLREKNSTALLLFVLKSCCVLNTVFLIKIDTIFYFFNLFQSLIYEVRGLLPEGQYYGTG